MNSRHIKDLLLLLGVPQLLRRRPAWGSHRWILDPPSPAGRKICLLASYSSSGQIADHTVYLAKMWAQHGYGVILVLATDCPDAVSRDVPPFIEGMLVRPNGGYDFGSWAHALSLRRDLRKAHLLALTNDSVYGPLRGFDRLLSRVDQSNASVIAATDSYERVHHLQSFLIFYKSSFLKSRAFRTFWYQFHGHNRQEVIDKGELGQLSWLNRRKVRVDVLFPADREFVENATLIKWRQLLDSGFPFVKVQLLRDNPNNVDVADWEAVVAQHDYDPDLVRKHLGRV